MVTQPPPRPNRTFVGRRTVALVTGLVTQLVILAALAVAAWSSPDSEYQPAISFRHGLGALVVFGGLAAVFVVAAAACIAATRRWWGPVLATVLIAVAGVIGFVGFVLTSICREVSIDC